jgi:hypothetical protein
MSVLAIRARNCARCVRIQFKPGAREPGAGATHFAERRRGGDHGAGHRGTPRHAQIFRGRLFIRSLRRWARPRHWPIPCTRSQAGGESFEDLAKKHSRCPTASNGGEIGWVSKGQLVRTPPNLLFNVPRSDLLRSQR